MRKERIVTGMVEGYRVVQRLPTLEEYRDLCTAVGWAPVMNFDAAREAIPASLFGVVVTHDRHTVGMGRIVGDGAIYYYLQDIAVLPEHQGRGLGKEIVAGLLTFLAQTAPDGAFIGLFSTPEGKELYERYGFAQYQELVGMFQTTPLNMKNHK